MTAVTALESARAATKDSDLAKAEHLYKEILSKPAGTSEKAIADQEIALYELGALYRDHKYVTVEVFFGISSKARCLLRTSQQ